MGVKQSKIEGSYLPTTPSTQKMSPQHKSMNVKDEESEMLDPRSPTASRTPMQLSNNCIDTQIQLSTIVMPERDSHPDRNPLDFLRRRFLKGFTYNLNDPRSPSLHLNRTPLIFEDTFEKSLNLNDTFTDLFVDSRQSEGVTKMKEQKKSVENLDIEMPEEKAKEEEEEKPVTKLTPRTPLLLQQELDPRSPSIGVERTPLFLADDEADDEAIEDAMLENILSTLSLNLNSSGTSSVASQNPITNDSLITHSKPMNKHLDLVRGTKKLSNKGIHHHKTKRRISRQQIYEDCENQTPTTPKLKASQVDKNDSPKSTRTPLRSVLNRNGNCIRSRSVESSAKSIKTRLALSSFDDTLNLSENKNVNNMIIMQQDDAQDLFES